MAKALKRPIILSDSSEDSDIDQEAHSIVSSLAKRPKPSVPAAQSSGSGYSSDSNSDAEWTMDKKTMDKNPPGSHIGMGATKKGPTNTKKIRGGKTMVYRKSAPKKPSSSSSDSSEDEDEDEDEDSQHQKQDSSSSGDSSSDSDTSSEDSRKFDDGYDENMIGDEEDQKKLDLMLEAEREQEMFQRYEKREALKARFEIQMKLHRQKKHDKKKLREKKLKQSLKDGRRKPQDRIKTNHHKRSQAMTEYKANRSADKIRKAEAEKSLDEKAPLRASDIFFSSDSEYSSCDASSSNEDDDKTGEDLVASELSKIRLSRYRLEKWVHMPFFSTIIVGCFVRIGIGAHEGRMVYRICEIIGAQEGPKVYSLGSTKTNKALKLRHGIQERIFRMEYVSNSPFSESEFEKWKVEMDKRGLDLPRLDFVKAKVKKLEEVRNKSLKEEDVEKIIQEKQRFRKNPRNYAMTKSRMIREKEMAEQEGDVEKVGKLTTRLVELEERADLLDKQRTKGLSAISYINERNRQKNVIRSEMALKEELAGMEGKEDDPFTRRKCQPTLLKLAGRDSGTSEQLQKSEQMKKSAPVKDASSTMKAPELDQSTPNGKSSKLSADSTPSNQVSAPPIHLKSEMDDLFSAHDFDIQIDLPSGGDGTSTPKTLPKSDATPRQEGPKRSLNLADYKKRRGLI